MHERERVKLLFGPYRTPRCKVGRSLRCAIRGKATVRGLTDAPIKWPYTYSEKKANRPSLILCGALADAVRQESVQAVKYWFGVGRDTVWRWRKTLGVARQTPGTVDLQRRYAPESVLSEKAKRKLARVQRSPERIAKLAAAQRGKPRPPHVIEAIRKARLGRKASAETRRKMSEAHRLRGVS